MFYYILHMMHYELILLQLMAYNEAITFEVSWSWCPIHSFQNDDSYLFYCWMFQRNKTWTRERVYSLSIRFVARFWRVGSCKRVYNRHVFLKTHGWKINLLILSYFSYQRALQFIKFITLNLSTIQIYHLHPKNLQKVEIRCGDIWGI